jgi:hypothetical protein
LATFGSRRGADRHVLSAISCGVSRSLGNRRGLVTEGGDRVEKPPPTPDRSDADFFEILGCGS